MKYIAYGGANSNQTHPHALCVLECDGVSGAFRVVKKYDNIPNAIYMALNSDCTRLYTVMEGTRAKGEKYSGSVASFKLDSAGANLELMNVVPTGWTVPCHVSLSPDEKTLVYAEYSCGTFGYAGIKNDGSLDPSCAAKSEKINQRCQAKHVGEGPNKPRQNAAHPHCSLVTPDGKYLLVVDLTLDKVVAYDFINRMNGLKEVESASIDTRKFAPGAGPRHIIFHPNGKTAFLIFELMNKVASFKYDGRGFELVEVKDLLPADFNEFSKAAAIKISEDGAQLFCSNRGHDSITVFNIDPETGKMKFLNNSKLAGKFPRDFEFFPGGKYCLVGHKLSSSIATYSYNKYTGIFNLVQSMDGFHLPLFFKFKTKCSVK